MSVRTKYSDTKDPILRKLMGIDFKLRRIEEERERLNENRTCDSSPLKIAQFSDTPIMADLTNLDAHDLLRYHLYQVLAEREEQLVNERKSLLDRIQQEGVAYDQ